MAPCEAKKLYQGAIFKKTLRYCFQESFDEIYILSAKHGVLDLDQKIEPYDKTLSRMTQVEKKEWDRLVISQLKEKNIKGEFWFFCGKNYYENIILVFPGKTPWKNLRIGKILKWLSNNLKKGAFFNESVDQFIRRT